MSPQTKKNFETVMALEALAHAKYTRFAACARLNGHQELAKLFQVTADVDRSTHFRKEIDYANAPCDDLANLQSAVDDKTFLIAMYLDCIRQAEAEGDYLTANLLDSIRRDELVQLARFKEAFNQMCGSPSARQIVNV